MCVLGHPEPAVCTVAAELQTWQRNETTGSEQKMRNKVKAEPCVSICSQVMGKQQEMQDVGLERQLSS